jgi:hypothetical protein
MRVRKLLELKYDLGLFHNPYVSEENTAPELTLSHIPLALEAAQKSVVLLENRKSTLPLRPSEQNIQKIALIGPYADTFNFGSYSGTWGANPTDRASTIRQGLLRYLAQDNLLSAWGANTWNYNAQHPIPGYLLSANGTQGGLQATYYHDTNFQQFAYQLQETPNRDWGLYPPPRLTSTSFSVIWEGKLEVPVSTPVHGSIGVAVSPGTIVRLYIDQKAIPLSGLEGSRNGMGTILGEILPYTFAMEHGTDLPPGGAEFLFAPGAIHNIRIECEAHPDWPREGAHGVHTAVQLWWNLADRKDAVGQVRCSSPFLAVIGVCC